MVVYLGNLLRDSLAKWKTSNSLMDATSFALVNAAKHEVAIEDLELAFFVFLCAARHEMDVAFWYGHAKSAMGSELPGKIHKWVDATEPATRADILESLAVVGDEALVSTFATCLFDPWPRVRTHAIWGLEQIGTTFALAQLDGGLQYERYVTQGEFLRGDDMALSDEKPSSSIFLDGFYINKYPVTDYEYSIFVNDQAAEIPLHWYFEGMPRRDSNRPVIWVTWFDAAAYANWCGRRLPTEAEWEKAARGTDARQWPWGNAFESSFCNTAEYGLNSRSSVSAFEEHNSSPYGVVDMAGNVLEWTGDWYDRCYYKDAPTINPTGALNTGSKVLRGGSWRFGRQEARCAFRDNFGPSVKNDGIGFRVAFKSRRKCGTRAR